MIDHHRNDLFVGVAQQRFIHRLNDKGVRPFGQSTDVQFDLVGPIGAGDRSRDLLIDLYRNPRHTWARVFGRESQRQDLVNRVGHGSLVQRHGGGPLVQEPGGQKQADSEHEHDDNGQADDGPENPTAGRRLRHDHSRDFSTSTRSRRSSFRRTMRAEMTVATMMKIAEKA